MNSLLLKIDKDGDVTTSFGKEFQAVIQRCEKKSDFERLDWICNNTV